MAGAFSHATLLEKAETLSTRLDELYKSSPLPEQPDTERAENLLKQVTTDWENQYANTRHTTS